MVCAGRLRARATRLGWRACGFRADLANCLDHCREIAGHDAIYGCIVVHLCVVYVCMYARIHV